MRVIKKIIKMFYNEKIESLCTRLLYFFNTLNSFYLFSGIATFLFVLLWSGDIQTITFVNIAIMLVVTVVVFVLLRVADFYPFFLIFNIPGFFLLVYSFDSRISLLALGINLFIFFFLQIGFMGIPDSIVGRDVFIIPRKILNSMITIAPTTVSFLISVYFSYFQFQILWGIYDRTSYGILGIVFLNILLSSIICWYIRPRNHYSKNLQIDPTHRRFKRVFILNIDGCRLDIFNQLDLPNIRKIIDEGTWYKNGLTTVYRALTNPAFASITTGCIPEDHGIRDNNFGQNIKVEGLPDLVPTALYGSMHIKHFSKDSWDVKVISLPTLSVYNSDDEMIRLIQEDVVNRDELRLFIADFSEADFLGHAYGSTSTQYKEALKRIDKRIGDFIVWLEDQKLHQDSGVIICSDHGISEIDHSYLIRPSEKYVPCILWGNSIRKNHVVEESYKIMDIASTVSFMLDIPYPKQSQGRPLLEAFEDINLDETTTNFITEMNNAFYKTVSSNYIQKHPEIYYGDKSWWIEKLEAVLEKISSDRELRILDFGCGCGFVGETFLHLKHTQDLRYKFVCFDTNKEVLEIAKSRLDSSNYIFESNFDEILKHAPYDIVALNSVLHHIYDPKVLTRKLSEIVNVDGFVLGGHEPNGDFFGRYSLSTLMARIAKYFGGGKFISKSDVIKINEIINQNRKHPIFYSEESIYQVVEFHSPVEQYKYDIDINEGFSYKSFISDFWPGFTEVELNTYTSFFYRNILVKLPFVQYIFKSLFMTVFRGGNLIHYIARKGR